MVYVFYVEMGAQLELPSPDIASVNTAIEGQIRWSKPIGSSKRNWEIEINWIGLAKFWSYIKFLKPNFSLSRPNLNTEVE